MTTLTTRTDTKTAAAASGKGARTWVMPIYVVFGLLGGAAAMVLTGAWAPTLIGDAGPLARLGQPVPKFVFNSAMTLAVASLIMASMVFPRTDAITRDRKGATTGDDNLDPVWLGSVQIAQVASVVWTLSGVAVLVLTYVSTAGGQAYAGNFSAQLGQYVSQVDSGRLWLTIVLATAVTSTVIVAVRSFAGIAWATAFSLFPLIPLALMGHTVGASGHTQAVNSLGRHHVGGRNPSAGTLGTAPDSPGGSSQHRGTLLAAGPGRGSGGGLFGFHERNSAREILERLANTLWHAHHRQNRRHHRSRCDWSVAQEVCDRAFG